MKRIASHWYSLLLALGLLWASPAQAVMQCAYMGDADYTATTLDTCIYVAAPFTAPRTIHLPHAGATQLGQGTEPIRYADGLLIIDIANAVSPTNTLTLAPYAGDATHGNTSVFDTPGVYVIAYPLSGSDWWVTQHGSTGSPAAGTNGQIQYNSAGVLGGFTTSGDATINTTTGALTFATVNANVGTFGSATSCVTVTSNAKGLTTAISAATCTPAIGSITGLGTGIATALGVNVGTAGAPVINGGALGTPSSGTLTNATGLPTTGLTGTLQAAQEPAHTGDCTNTAGSLALTCLGAQPAVSTILNCSLAASVASNNLTIALKTATGADPSAASPCSISFRSTTPTNGGYSNVLVTAATSIVFNSGSGFGAPSSSTPFRLWVTAWNNAGTVVLGVSNQVGANQIYPINESDLQSSTACNACATATSAGVFYTTAAQTTKAIRILGYMSWESGLTTTGVWAVNPTAIQPMIPGVKLPGSVVQEYFLNTVPAASTSTSAFVASSAARNMTLYSAANVVRLEWAGNAINTGGANGGVETRAYRGSAACTTAVGSQFGIENVSLNMLVSFGGQYTEVPYPSATNNANYTICFNAPTNLSVTWPYLSNGMFHMYEIMG